MTYSKAILNILSSRFPDLTSKAWEGDLEAWNGLGIALLGDGNLSDNEDMDLSVSCFLYAARKGHAKAQFNLGMSYLVGFRMKNFLRAVEWFRRSAENGEPWAMYVVGLMEEIVRVGKDEESGKDAIDRCQCDESLVWYARAALAGNAYAKLAMALAEDMGHAPRGTLQKVDDLYGGHWDFPLRRHDLEKACGLYEQAWKSGLDWGFIKSRHLYLMELVRDDAFDAAKRYLDTLDHYETPERDDYMRFVDGVGACDLEERSELRMISGRIQDGVYLCSELLRTPYRYISAFEFAGTHVFASHRLLSLSRHSSLVSISREVRQLCQDVLQGHAAWMNGGCGGSICDDDGSGPELSYSLPGEIFIERLFAGMENLSARDRCKGHSGIKFYFYENKETADELTCGVDDAGVTYLWRSVLRKFVRGSWTRDISEYDEKIWRRRRVLLGRAMKRMKRSEEYSEYGSLYLDFRKNRGPCRSYAQWWKENCPYSDFPRVSRDSHVRAWMQQRVIYRGEDVGDLPESDAEMVEFVRNLAEQAGCRDVEEFQDFIMTALRHAGLHAGMMDLTNWDAVLTERETAERSRNRALNVLRNELAKTKREFEDLKREYEGLVKSKDTSDEALEDIKRRIAEKEEDAETQAASAQKAEARKPGDDVPEPPVDNETPRGAGGETPAAAPDSTVPTADLFDDFALPDD